MIFAQSVLDALEAISTEAWEGEVWRVVFGLRSPLLANTTGARWNPPDVAALYTSLDRNTVLAELDHLRGIQTPATRRSAYRLHRVRVRVDHLVDLRDITLLRSMGVDEERLVADDHAACQQVGGAAAWLGRDGILVPSARGVGDNLVIFVNRQAPDAALELLETNPLSE